MAIVSWFSLLSARQKSWLFGTVFVMLAIVGVGLYLTTSAEEPAPATFTTDMSIQQVAPKLGVTGKALARELGLDLEIPKKKPLKALGVSDEEFQHAVEHLLSHRDANLKYFVYAALALGAVVFLVRLGRPEGADVQQRKRWYPRAP